MQYRRATAKTQAAIEPNNMLKVKSRSTPGKRKEKQREQTLTYNAIQNTFHFVKGILKD